MRRYLPRGTVRAGVAAAMLATAAPSVAWAEVMPQLNFANPLTTSQVVWMFIIFLALYLMLANWGLPQVAHVVNARSASIKADLDAARGAKEASDAAVAELTEATRRAHAEAQAQIAAAVDAAKQEAAAQARQMNERLEAQLAESEARIAAARGAAMGALRQVAAETAAVVVTRLTGQPADTQAVDAAVARTLAARRA